MGQGPLGFVRGLAIRLRSRILGDMANASDKDVPIDSRQLLDHMNGRVIVVSKDRRLLAVNAETREYLGRDPTGEVCHQAWHKLNQPCEHCQLDRVLAGETITDERYDEQEDRWYHSRHMPIRTLDGSMAKLTVVADITVRKRTENAMRESETRYRLLLENLDDMVFSLDLEGNFVYVSDVVEKFSGYRPDEVLGQPFAKFVHPDEFARLAEDWMRCLAGEHVQAEFSALIKDGSTRQVRTSSRPVRSNGQVVGASGVMTDLSALRQAEQDKQALEEQLHHSQKMEALGRMAGGVAHDFNNLLFVIINHAQFLLQGLPADTPEKTQAQRIEKAAQKAAELTQKLLAFSRRDPVAPRVLDLGEAVAEMQDLLERIVGEDVSLTTKLFKDPLRVLTDPAQLSQVLMNLVANSRDAMPKGGQLAIETKRIEATQLPAQPGAGPFATLEVRDTGLGMKPEVAVRAFEPYFTTKPPGQSAGLGLSTAYSAIQQSGGWIDIDTTPGGGTRMRVILPLTDAPLDATPAHGIRAMVKVEEKVVLVVEDQREVRELVTSMLQELGAEVLVADGPAQALHLAKKRKEPIHLLLTDVVMPDMNGRVLAGRIRQLRPEIRVLYMSAWLGDELQGEVGSDLDAPLLHKPFQTGDLLSKLHEVLSPEG